MMTILSAEDQVRRASLQTGLGLFGYRGTWTDDVAKWAKKWGLKTGRVTGGGLIWHYPDEIWEQKISERVREEWGNAGFKVSDLEDYLKSGLGTDSYEYTFKITEPDRATGYDTSMGRYHLFSPEVISDRTYTYWPDTGICHAVYDLKSMAEVRQFLENL